MDKQCILRLDLKAQDMIPGTLKGIPDWLMADFGDRFFRYENLEEDTEEGYNMVIWLPGEDFVDLANSIDFDFPEDEEKEPEIMNVEHPKWDEFTDRLEGPEGCDFHKDERNQTHWQCSGESDRELSKKILREHYPDVDIDETMNYFSQHGGHCDCEILFNVAL